MAEGARRHQHLQEPVSVLPVAQVMQNLYRGTGSAMQMTHFIAASAFPSNTAKAEENLQRLREQRDNNIFKSLAALCQADVSQEEAAKLSKVLSGSSQPISLSVCQTLDVCSQSVLPECPCSFCCSDSSAATWSLSEGARRPLPGPNASPV